MMEEVYC